MARPTSWLGSSAAPLARTVSSTFCASSAIESSSTGRPWHALRTPVTILVRLNGSVTPLRLTTARTASSTVVNRLPHSGHERRRRISWPSSASRESTTRESGCRQYGQRIGTASSLDPADHHRRRAPQITAYKQQNGRDGVGTTNVGANVLTVGKRTVIPNLWMTYICVTTRCCV